ncbi:KTSC domain-containing protein [Pseudomonas sp. H1h]|uniref:KTSC domain-containing protein n=1 Tax=Pseudomonas sp. H1h TaxID=1397280 RepID=UPI00046A7ADD|nr:KTSC domain-containing protein [Pseudomonas sp. H1h]
MEMIAVYSRAITAVGYDAGTKRMRISFQQGHSYDFYNVPLDIYSGLMVAVSKGSYYNKHIRDRYQF